MHEDVHFGFLKRMYTNLYYRSLFYIYIMLLMCYILLLLSSLYVFILLHGLCLQVLQ